MTLPPHLIYFLKTNQLILDAMSSPNPTQPEEEYGDEKLKDDEEDTDTTN